MPGSAAPPRPHLGPAAAWLSCGARILDRLLDLLFRLQARHEAHRTEAPHPGASLKSPERDKAITTAALQLGILLAHEGDLNGARAAYQHAVDFGHTDMAPWPMVKLAIALIEHADMETAQAALQSALDTRHPPVVAVASLGLGNLPSLASALRSRDT